MHGKRKRLGRTGGTRTGARGSGRDRRERPVAASDYRTAERSETVRLERTAIFPRFCRGLRAKPATECRGGVAATLTEGAAGARGRCKKWLVIVLAPLVVALGTGEKPGLGLVGRPDLLHLVARAVVAALGTAGLGRGSDLLVVDLGHVDGAAVGVLALRGGHRRLLLGLAWFLVVAGATDPQAVVAVHHRAALVAEFHVAMSSAPDRT